MKDQKISMHISLTHLPLHKQQELQRLAHHICQQAPIEMIILFGSYARGDWVEDYAPDGIHLQYQSDFDLLVIVKTRSITEQNRLEQKLEDTVEALSAIQTPTSIIVHDIDYVNSQIVKGQYFFADIKKEGVLLYDTRLYQLEEPKQLSIKDRYHLAQEDYDYWFEKAKDQRLVFEFCMGQGKYNEAAFSLHQVAERLYNGALLVFTHYKPRTHNLGILRKLVNALDPRFVKVFPFIHREDRRRFELLRRAYIDARYNKGYVVTAEELDWLAEQVTVLEEVAHRLCKEKLHAFSHQGN